MTEITFVKKKKHLLDALSKIDGAIPSHGEASFGYSFKLANGTTLQIGQTDDDVSDKHILWIKQD